MKRMGRPHTREKRPASLLYACFFFFGCVCCTAVPLVLSKTAWVTWMNGSVNSRDAADRPRSTASAVPVHLHEKRQR